MTSDQQDIVDSENEDNLNRAIADFHAGRFTEERVFIQQPTPIEEARDNLRVMAGYPWEREDGRPNPSMDGSRAEWLATERAYEAAIRAPLEARLAELERHIAELNREAAAFSKRLQP